MKPFMGLLLLAVSVLFFAAPVLSGCPGGPDCIWVDQAACGECVGDGSDCSTNADCPPGTCVGVCSADGSTPCVGDQDCLPTLGFCMGTCAGTHIACFGDLGCTLCNGSTPGSGTQASPYCLVNEAFLAASDGDTLYVGPGAYKQCVELFGGALPVPEDRAVHLFARAFDESGGNPDTIGDTIIDGTDVCTTVPVVTLIGSGASMKGLTVTGGEASGVFVAGSVTITSNRITGNSSVLGGGVYAYPASCYYVGESVISITANEITDNQAIAGPSGGPESGLGHGGGIFALAVEPLGSGCNSTVDIEIEDNLVSGNTIENRNIAPEGDRYIAKGGGIYVATAMEPGGTARVSLTANVISGNGRTPATPASAGGGIFASTLADGRGTETIVIEGNAIGPDNQAHEGGGLAAWAVSGPGADHRITIAKNEIQGNLGVGSSSEGAGGGASLRLEAINMRGGDAASIEFRQNVVANNDATGSDGGGLRASVLSERSVDVPLGANVDPADRMELTIRDNTIRDNTAAVGGAGALLLVLADSDPDFFQSGDCLLSQLPAIGSIDFLRNLVVNNHASNLFRYTEVGAGILTIPTTVGEARATIRIEESTLAGNTIGDDFDSSGGLETLPFADPDCHFTLDATIAVTTDRSIVSGNDGFGIGGTPLGAPAPPGTLQVPVTNSYVHGNPSGNFEPEMYPVPPPSNFEIDPQLMAGFAPAACSPVFELRVCEGTTDVCQDDLDCPPGPPQVPCLAGVGFHGNPDIAPFVPDLVIDGMDTIGLAIAFGSTDAPDPRFSAPADLDHNGIVDGEDLSYIGSQFAEVCPP